MPSFPDDDVTVPLQHDRPRPPPRYCTSEQADKVLYPHCPREFRVMDYRMQVVAREIRGHAADLVMLQVCGPGGRAGGDAGFRFVSSLTLRWRRRRRSPAGATYEASLTCFSKVWTHPQRARLAFTRSGWTVVARLCRERLVTVNENNIFARPALAPGGACV